MSDVTQPVFTLVKAPQYARFLPEMGDSLLTEVRALEHARADLLAAVDAYAARVADYESNLERYWTSAEIAQARVDFHTRPYLQRR